jgi:hypothetical protein
MPLHDVGYRPWRGRKNWPWFRWWAIAVVGIQIAFRSSWLGRTLIVAWVPAIFMGTGFFAYEQSIVRPEMRQMVGRAVLFSGGGLELAQAVSKNPETVRHEVWSALLLSFFRYPQAIVMVIVVGIVSPRLISYDLRNRGYLLYFSRPIRVSEYLLGKTLVVWTFLALITTVPALLLYVVGLSVSPNMAVFWTTWDLPLRVLLASVALMLPTTAIALACSAMTIESRYAAFSWFAFWIVGWVSFSVLSTGEFAGRRPRRGPQHEFHDELARALTEVSRWELISPYHLLGRVQQWIFGLFPADHSIVPFLSVLATVTCIAIWFIHRQLRSRLTT